MTSSLFLQRKCQGQGLRLAICFTCPETASIGDPWGPLWLHCSSQRRAGGLRLLLIRPWTRRQPRQFSHLLWKPLCGQRQTSPDLCSPFPASPSLPDCFEDPRVCGSDWQGLRAQQRQTVLEGRRSPYTGCLVFWPGSSGVGSLLRCGAGTGA